MIIYSQVASNCARGKQEEEEEEEGQLAGLTRVPFLFRTPARDNNYILAQITGDRRLSCVARSRSAEPVARRPARFRSSRFSVGERFPVEPSSVGIKQDCFASGRASEPTKEPKKSPDKAKNLKFNNNKCLS